LNIYYYGDKFNKEEMGRVYRMYKTVTKIKSKGIPITGLGGL
jgi:hypothetical protein